MFEAEDNFDLAKQLRIDGVENAINVANNTILINDRGIAKCKKSIKDAEKEISALYITLHALNEELLIKSAVDTSEIDSKIKSLEDSVDDVSTIHKDMEGIRSYISMLDDKRVELEKRIMRADNTRIQERIAELKEEQIKVAQSVADCEQKLYMLDSFIQQKLETISDTINSSFDGITFKLFDNQINGGVREVCEVAVDGVPFGSLNSGHRIVAGIEIIKSLQRKYNTYAPVWIDNAESISDGNIPEMDCQVIELRVNNHNLEVR